MKTSLVSSFDGFHYYVIFVDHFKNYIWLYPLRCKLDVHSTFVAFKKLVEIISPPPLKTLYTDNRGEFLAFRPFLATHGITHLTTTPHTLEHNGYSERWHRHIVETRSHSPALGLHSSNLLAVCFCYDCLFNQSNAQSWSFSWFLI